MKVKIESRYGITPNELLNDPKVSLKAKGLYGYMQSKPEGWKFTIAGVVSQSKDGKDSITQAMNELIEAGYLIRESKHNEAGHWDCDYTLLANNRDGLSVTVKPERLNRDGKTVTENPHIVRKNSNKEEVIKIQMPDPSDDESKLINKQIGEIINQMAIHVDPKNKRLYAHKVQREASGFLIEHYGYQKTIEMIEAIGVAKTRLHPSVLATTPIELRDKWVKIIADVNCKIELKKREEHYSKIYQSKEKTIF